MQHRQQYFIGAGLIALLLVGAGCYKNTTTNTNTANTVNTSSAPVAASSIAIQNLAFAPAAITVKVGTPVTWTNRDSISHQVIGDSGGPSSPSLSTGQSYSYTYSTVGTFTYHCSIHPSMTGTVTVTQ